MFQTMFNRGIIATLQPAAFFTAERHRGIVNNIANIDTPGYQMVDASVDDFREAFQRALEARDERAVPVFEFTGSQYMRPKPRGGWEVEFNEMPRQAGILRHDGNNVFIEKEMAKLSQNAGLHGVLVELLNHQFSLLERAIQERVA